ncbi:putative iron-regulated transporter [Aspergillus nomiae NRRL 13137]|uniref:Solute carrier family 40 member n=1 Tax=Aspergillus nomiae NRRL (strain ATCC 15546 / NRRL 13137 / CBS 260.88 / M93) TaxID=1509407 RepID=A0A0L1JI10_ASPN3|nr:putative iron-regulated transporter [Aspergillus nomiae NRRL 13137]KNG91396.1 putative iron-regulated transporter [Aspergillus nomiae NRRL 13137]
MASRVIESLTPSEYSPLLSGDPEPTHHPQSTFPHSPDERHIRSEVPRTLARRLYISHFLSTWNSRVFEFGAVLYLASIYPGTLLPMSVYALSRGVAAILFAPAVGNYIDTGNRLQVVRVSIMLQRVVVAASCLIFYLLAIGLPMLSTINDVLLVVLALLACVEKLCSIMNLVSVERDWVVVVAGNDHEGLKTMNAQMRRIDLICKLIGPLVIALVDGVSTKTAIISNLGMNICSVVFEYFLIAAVYYEVPELQQPKAKTYLDSPNMESDQQNSKTRLWRYWHRLTHKALRDFESYFRHPVFLPSFAGALLYLTVLSFSGQMVTWLLSTGYDSTQVGIARTLAVAFEVLATWIAPWLMGRISPTRAGLWFANWQIASLVAGMAIFWVFHDQPLISASGLVGGTILSRVGLRGFDLCVQILVQECVEAENRGSFSSVEAAWQNAFEIGSYVSTIVFSRPDQFAWPALISVVAVGLAGVLYAVFVRMQRGHLIHVPTWIAAPGMLQQMREMCIERIYSSSEV